MYCYVLDIEFGEGKFHEAADLVPKIPSIFRDRHGA